MDRPFLFLKFIYLLVFLPPLMTPFNQNAACGDPEPLRGDVKVIYLQSTRIPNCVSVNRVETGLFRHGEISQILTSI